MNARTKTKGPALAVPQSDDEADALLKEYGQHQRCVDDLQKKLDEALASVKAIYEGMSKVHKESLNSLFARLQAYAEANRKRLTDDGKTKTVELPAGKLAWRARPPSVVFKKGVAIETIVETLKSLGLRRFLRPRKWEVNKEALIEHRVDLKDMTIPDVSIVTGVEDFIVEPFGASLSEPKP